MLNVIATYYIKFIAVHTIALDSTVSPHSGHMPNALSASITLATLYQTRSIAPSTMSSVSLSSIVTTVESVH